MGEIIGQKILNKVIVYKKCCPTFMRFLGAKQEIVRGLPYKI